MKQIPPESVTVPWAPAEAQKRLVELEERLGGRAPEEIPEAVRTILQTQSEEVDNRDLVLYAGTNAASPLVRRFLGSSIETRSSMGYPGDKYQAYLVEHVEELEVLTTDLMRRAFGARYAEIRIQSGTLANLAIYSTFANPGDTIAVLPESGGGHISHHSYGAPRIRGLKGVDLPYTEDKMNVDLEKIPDVLAKERPKIIVLGASLLLFPHPIRQVREMADEVGALVVYDAAHVDGLIAGGHFQQPLEEGAHLVTSSTYKSLGGPSGGMILTNDPKLAQRVTNTVYPGLTANYDAGRLAALAVALAESLEFGKEYAEACMANAKGLGGHLHEEGFDVAAADIGYTASHHLAIDAKRFGGGSVAAKRLGTAGIHTSGIGLPWQEPDEDYRGIRLGTQEITKRGLKPEHMRKVAEWMGSVLLREKDPSTIREEVNEFRSRFPSYEYCYSETES
jgi:glycine hydroxymethyltransferase